MVNNAYCFALCFVYYQISREFKGMVKLEVSCKNRVISRYKVIFAQLIRIFSVPKLNSKQTQNLNLAFHDFI